MDVVSTEGAFRRPAAGGVYLGELKQIADELLFQNQPGALREAAARLYSFFSRVTGLDEGPQRPGDSSGTLLPTGKALSLRDAAVCVLDYARTSAFLKGTYAAVRRAQGRFPGGPVMILYAGCGPFATLALPLATQFGPGQVQFTLLDIHPESLESARRAFQSLGLGRYVRDHVRGDASTYAHPPAEPLHMVITETMQRALEKEPQVAVTANLAPQLCPGGILIPERITVDANLCDLSKEFTLAADAPDGVFHPGGTDRARINLGRVFELTAENARGLLARRKDSPAGEARLPAAAVEIPEGVGEGLQLVLSTTVTVFDSVVLGEYDSSITLPVILRDVKVGGRRTGIEFSYALGSAPGFRHRRV
ncbi:MAG TPA: class I SAM-dependent methyltransferase [Pyrinomonadaceae bacterium]|jgi:hypothetical protein